MMISAARAPTPTRSAHARARDTRQRKSGVGAAGGATGCPLARRAKGVGGGAASPNARTLALRIRSCRLVEELFLKRKLLRGARERRFEVACDHPLAVAVEDDDGNHRRNVRLHTSRPRNGVGCPLWGGARWASGCAGAEARRTWSIVVVAAQDSNNVLLVVCVELYSFPCSCTHHCRHSTECTKDEESYVEQRSSLY